MKLGVMFLANHGVLNLEVWEAWRRDASYEVAFFVHKKQKASHASDAYNIPAVIPTQYLKPSIVRASIELVKHAHAQQCTHCILVSGDTIPLKSPDLVLVQISTESVTITQFGTENGWPIEVSELFSRIHLKNEVICYHHQFFGMRREAMEHVVHEEARIMCLVHRAHKAVRQMASGLCMDEVWLNFVHMTRSLTRLVYFKPHNDRGLWNPPLTKRVRHLWSFARKFDAVS